jgi:hypothetical protein
LCPAFPAGMREQGVNEEAYSPVTCLPAGDRPLATVMRYPYSVDPSALLRETMPLLLARL